MQYLRLRYVRFSLVFATLISVLFGSICSAAQSENTEIILGTATKGGGFQLFGQNLAEVINLTDTDLQVQAIATRGSKQNIPFLEEDRIDIGLVEGSAARQALDGIGRAQADLSVLSVMYPNPGMFVVRADSPYQRIEDLRDKPIKLSNPHKIVKWIESHRTRGKIVLEGFG